jgi:hypothetical protein
MSRQEAPRRRITSIAPMPGALRIIVLAAVTGIVIAGCGSDEGTIPQDSAEALTNRLDSIESNVGEGRCPEAEAQAEGFKSDVNLLPASVEDDVKQGLQEAASQLVNLTTDDCEPESGATDAGGVVPTDATETEPTTTETTTTEATTADTTSEEQPTEEEPTQEPETTDPQEDQSLAPDGNQGQGGGVGSDGGIGPGGGGGQ